MMVTGTKLSTKRKARFLKDYQTAYRGIGIQVAQRADVENVHVEEVESTIKKSAEIEVSQEDLNDGKED